MPSFTRRMALVMVVGLACSGHAPAVVAASPQGAPNEPLVLGVFAFRPKPIIEERFAALGSDPT